MLLMQQAKGGYIRSLTKGIEKIFGLTAWELAKIHAGLVHLVKEETQFAAQTAVVQAVVLQNLVAKFRRVVQHLKNWIYIAHLIFILQPRKTCDIIPLKIKVSDTALR